jgi:hypothetical protein
VASKEGLATPTRLHRASQSIQRWEWDNVPATFRTENTENNAGDSEYSVLAADYMRYAPINTLRNLPDQVYLRGERCFAYFGAAQVKPIMGQADDSKLAVDVAAQGTGIKVKDVVNRTEAAGSRVPWVGATVFDAARCAGKWKQGDVHVGHNVKDLGKPLPNISNPAWVAKQKWVRR